MAEEFTLDEIDIIDDDSGFEEFSLDEIDILEEPEIDFTPLELRGEDFPRPEEEQMDPNIAGLLGAGTALKESLPGRALGGAVGLLGEGAEAISDIAEPAISGFQEFGMESITKPLLRQLTGQELSPEADEFVASLQKAGAESVTEEFVAPGILGLGIGSFFRYGQQLFGKAVEQTKRLNVKLFEDATDQELLDTAKKLDIDLPPTATSKNAVVDKIHEYFGGAKHIKKAEKASEDIIDEWNKVSAQFGDAGTATTGKKIKDAWDNLLQARRTAASSIYDEVLSKEVLGAQGDASRTTGFIDEVLSEKNLLKGSKKIFNELKDSLSKKVIKEKPSTILGPGGAPAAVTPGRVEPITFEELRNTRTEVGALLKIKNNEFINASKANLAKLYSSLSEDMNDILRAKNATAYDRIKKADKMWSDVINISKTSAGKRIKSADSGSLVSMLTGKQNIDKLRVAKQVLDKDTFDHLRVSYVADVVQKSLDRSGNINPFKLKVGLNKAGTEVLDELLDPTSRRQLEGLVTKTKDLNKLLESTKKATRIGQASQNAESHKAIAGATAIGVGGLPAVIPVLKLFFANNMITKWVQSGTGQRFLTEGTKFTGETGRRILQAAPEIGTFGLPAATGAVTDRLLQLGENNEQ